MTVIPVKPLLLLFLWSLLCLALQRAFPRSRCPVAFGAGPGFAAGGAVLYLLLGNGGGDGVYGGLRLVGGGCFLILLLSAVVSVYRGVDIAPTPGSGASPGWRGTAWSGAFVAGLAAGAFSVAAVGRQPATAGIMLAAAVAVGVLAARTERLLPASVPVAPESLPLAVVSLLLGMGGLSPRLNLFTPLTMKVMKFIHDLVHQLFETLLVPDHPFFRPEVWRWIGLLFSKDVGFWGGIIIWFAPVALIAVALGRARLPSVAHIRQGARRRSLLAGLVRERNRRFLVPAGACVVLCLAVYTSLSPMVEYWDPKPLAVTAAPNGEIVIPKKAAGLDLEDGQLHKFMYRQGGTTARFFVLMRSDARLVACLDACSICQPQGYGQGEGTVICYYCRTLIPIETVGKPGGCNPVPLPLSERTDAVAVDSHALVTTWENTAIAVGKGQGGMK
jgi:hypothetical protein